MRLLEFLSSIISFSNKIAQLKIPQHSDSRKHNGGLYLKLAQNLRSCPEQILPRKKARDYQPFFFPVLHKITFKIMFLTIIKFMRAAMMFSGGKDSNLALDRKSGV